MKKDVLLVSYPSDVHTISVAEALKKKNCPVLFWSTSDFPTLSTESVSISKSGARIWSRGPSLLFDNPQPSSVWHRRPRLQPDLAMLDPADRVFASQQCETFRRAFLHLLAPDAFWVNAPAASSRANNKVLQQKTAVECGLTIPETLYSNDPDDIREFIAAQGNSVIYKVLAGGRWLDDTETWVSFATVLTTERLVDDDILRQTPGIFQEIVPKEYELRVTIMGHQPFAARVLSQETTSGKTDWRKAYKELRMVPDELPGGVLNSCLDLMRRLSIVFGCFDFIVKPGGEYVFLEVNEMGQFLFVESYTDFPLLDAFSDFLIEGDPEFRYRRKDPAVRFSDMVDIMDRLLKEYTEGHAAESPEGYQERKPSSSARTKRRRVLGV